MAGKHDDIIRTIRLEPREIARLLQDVRDEEHRTAFDSDREEERVWTELRRLTVNLGSAESGVRAFEVFLRNLSAGGACFIHGVYLHTGTPCLLRMRTRTGRVTAIPARVVRCRFVAGKLHEVGVSFERSIKLSDFIDPEHLPLGDTDTTVNVDVLEGIFTEIIDAARAPASAPDATPVRRILEVVHRHASRYGLKAVRERASI